MMNNNLRFYQLDMFVLSVLKASWRASLEPLITEKLHFNGENPGNRKLLRNPICHSNTEKNRTRESVFTNLYILSKIISASKNISFTEL